MSNIIVGPALIPPAVSLIDASEPFRLVILVAAATAVAILFSLAGLAGRRPAPKAVVARHTFRPLAPAGRPGHEGRSAA